MANNKPNRIPRWQGSNGIIEPTEAKKNEGWEIEKPPFQFFNWLFNFLWRWPDYLNRLFNTAFFLTPNNTSPRIQTLDFDVDFVPDNIINVAIDKAYLNLLFDTDQTTTLTNIAGAIQGTDNVASATVTGARQITITSVSDSIFDILEIEVLNGIQQATGTLATTQPGRFFDYQFHAANSIDFYSGGILGASINSSGYLQIPQKLEHKDDSDTYLEFENNRIKFVAGGLESIDIENDITLKKDLIDENDVRHKINSNNEYFTSFGANNSIVYNNTGFLGTDDVWVKIRGVGSTGTNAPVQDQLLIFTSAKRNSSNLMIRCGEINGGSDIKTITIASGDTTLVFKGGIHIVSG